MSTPAATDPGKTRFEATVERYDGTSLVLDRSYFYPEGGGQPPDRGTIAGVPVVDVQKRDGEIVHIVDTETNSSIEPGASVDCAIDERFRTYCRRAHTASHVLYGAGRRLLSDLGYGGFGITDEKVRVDFSTTTDINDDILCEMEHLVNEVVWNSHPVRWEELSREEALAHDTIAFNTKTEEGLTGTDRIRVVTIEGVEHGTTPSEPWDTAACGGTHVRNTCEIGPVTVLERSNPGEGLTRVEFAVGTAGIERRMTEKRAALNAARTLETNVVDAPDAIERLQAQQEECSNELAALQEQLVDARLAELRENVIERDGRTWLVGTVEGLDANELAEQATELAGEAADVVALVNGSQLAVSTEETDTDADAIIASVTEEFGGGGGGSPTVAQGGGLGGTPTDVVAYLREGRANADNTESKNKRG